MIYIGIHRSLNGISVEFTDAYDREDAFEQMERNDTELTVLTQFEMDKLCCLSQSNKDFINTAQDKEAARNFVFRHMVEL